jgi:hypothetical protein
MQATRSYRVPFDSPANILFFKTMTTITIAETREDELTQHLFLYASGGSF